MPQHFLVKSEPDVYPWERLVKEKKARWDGVRNFGARNNLRAMKKGDLVLFYHSNEGKDVVGVATVVKEAYPDPTAEEGDWSAVDLAPVKALAKSVTLAQIKAEPSLSEMQLVTRGRLSVQVVEKKQFDKILALAGTKL
ncbi:MAG TPA: EVE domain-containing protein [Polyangiaceae bacterium]|nr:EVE domain-containing protein [Polyangiaceae bacterium]